MPELHDHPIKAKSTMPPATRGRRRRAETREELLSRLLDPTLTLDETALMLDVCPATVRRYTNRGILPHERSKGNQRRFKLSSVLAFMEANRHELLMLHAAAGVDAGERTPPNPIIGVVSTRAGAGPRTGKQTLDAV